MTFSAPVCGSTNASTGVDCGAEGTVFELPPVVILLDLAISLNRAVGITLRTFEPETVAFLAPNGFPIPVKTVRGWFIANSEVRPLLEAEVFDAFCTDHSTGDLISPERGLEYADGWQFAV